MDGIVEDREELGKRWRDLERREKKLRELQEKFEEIVPELIQETIRTEDIPEIVEDLGGFSKTNRHRQIRAKTLRTILCLIGVVVLSMFALHRFTFYVKSQGDVVPAHRGVLKAPIDGIIEALNFHEGDKVEKGDVVASIRVTGVSSELKKAKEELEAVLRQISLMTGKRQRLKVTAKRKGTLLEQNIIAFREFEEAQADYDESALKHEELIGKQKKLESSILSLEDKMSQSKLIAPLSGVIVTHAIQDKNGVFLEKNEKLCEIADLGQFVVEASFPENESRTIRVGQEAMARFRTSRKWHHGKVSMIAPFSGKSNSSVEQILAGYRDHKKGVMVTIEMERLPDEVKYGMDATVKIITKRVRLWDLLASWL